jgi:hypothetical protein
LILWYQYESRFGFKEVGNANGKVFLNVQYIEFPYEVLTPHRPAMKICPPPYGRFVDGGQFLLLHYVGSWEAYSFRTNDARNGISKKEKFWRKRAKMSRIHEPITATWFDGFIQNVGTERASRLLRHTGLPRGYNGSVSRYEALIAAEEDVAMA